MKINRQFNIFDQNEYQSDFNRFKGWVLKKVTNIPSEIELNQTKYHKLITKAVPPEWMTQPKPIKFSKRKEITDVTAVL